MKKISRKKKRELICKVWRGVGMLFCIFAFLMVGVENQSTDFIVFALMTCRNIAIAIVLGVIGFKMIKSADKIENISY